MVDGLDSVRMGLCGDQEIVRVRAVSIFGGDMLEVNKDLLKGLDVELELDDTEKSVLASFVKQRGFDIIQKIMEDQVRKFNFKLINSSGADSAEVCANHLLAKAVAQFYVGLMHRINVECSINAYNNRDRNVVEDAITTAVEEFK